MTGWFWLDQQSGRTLCLGGDPGFGESSLDLELRIWINDPQNGRANVISEVLLGIWDAFQENGVVIPLFQCDLHIRSQADFQSIHP